MGEVKKEFARVLRKDPTKTEKMMWDFLRRRKFMGFKFRRQHVISGFVLDFYCHGLKLGIEIDGGIHQKRKDYDNIRQGIIESKGITIIRISNEDILENKKRILKRIEEVIEYLSDPSLHGRGVETKSARLT